MAPTAHQRRKQTRPEASHPLCKPASARPRTKRVIVPSTTRYCPRRGWSGRGGGGGGGGAGWGRRLVTRFPAGRPVCCFMLCGLSGPRKPSADPRYRWAIRWKTLGFSSSLPTGATDFRHHWIAVSPRKGDGNGMGGSWDVKHSGLSPPSDTQPSPHPHPQTRAPHADTHWGA